MSARVAVLGAGTWGSTLAWLFARGGHEVRLWSSNADKRGALRASRRPVGTKVELPDNVVLPDSLAEAVDAQLLVFAIPPAFVREAAREAAPFLRPDQRAVHVVKGLAPCGSSVSRILDEETLLLQVGALGGPVVPQELQAGAEGAAVVGSRYQAVIDDVVELMASEQVRVYGNRDLRGVEVGGAMRTPLALAAGALGGVGAPKAVSAILLTRGMAEAGRMCEALGGERQTVSGLSGIGDWMLTVGDPHDELMLAGARLGRGEACDHPEAEGRVRSLLEQAARLRVDLPIVKAVAALLDGHPVAEVLAGLMTRAAQPEFR